MKIAPLIFTLILISCNKSAGLKKTKMDIAKDSISSYLQLHLHDPSSFELVQYLDFDTIYSTAYGDKNKYYKSIQDSLLTLSTQYNVLSEESQRLFDLSLSYYDTLSNLLDDTTYIGKFKGYSLTQKYRAKNQMGALGLHTVEYTFDTSMNIINVTDLDD